MMGNKHFLSFPAVKEKRSYLLCKLYPNIVNTEKERNAVIKVFFMFHFSASHYCAGTFFLSNTVPLPSTSFEVSHLTGGQTPGRDLG